MDRLPELLTKLLDCAEERLSIPVCRSFINPGPNAPWDTCSTGVNGEGVETNGQLWVAHLRTTPEWPVPTSVATPCSPLAWTAQVELGITRCQQGVTTDEQDGIPDADLITADAALQQVDRFELLQAILCCWGVEERDIVFDRWEAYEPSGGCVASRWILFVRVGKCAC